MKSSNHQVSIFKISIFQICFIKIIDSDVTPLAFPINKSPNRPKEPISEEFVFPKALGLLPED